VKKRIDALQNELGFTLIEVMVAISVLLIGVLGAVTMLNTANASTDRNQSRNSATNLVRDILEASRAIPYGDARPTTTSSGVADPTLQNALQNMRPLSGQSSLSDAAATTGWQIIRRGVTYDVTAAATTVPGCLRRRPATRIPTTTAVSRQRPPGLGAGRSSRFPKPP
jgi:type IV pilus modification protein PilV